MAKNHTKIEAVAEKLLSLIVKECDSEASEGATKENQNVIRRAQALLKAAEENSF